MTRWPILLFLLPALVSAEQAADSDVSLAVKPVLCITDKRNPRCNIAFLVEWHSQFEGYFCLFNDFLTTPLRCWTNRRGGRLSDQRSVEESFTYWITSDESALRLAQASVEVLRLDSDDRRRKRRTRHVWDIN